MLALQSYPYATSVITLLFPSDGASCRSSEDFDSYDSESDREHTEDRISIVKTSAYHQSYNVGDCTSLAPVPIPTPTDAVLELKKNTESVLGQINDHLSKERNLNVVKMNKLLEDLHSVLETCGIPGLVAGVCYYLPTTHTTGGMDGGLWQPILETIIQPILSTVEIVSARALEVEEDDCIDLLTTVAEISLMLRGL